MSQFNIPKSLYLKLFNDEILKSYMNIPSSDKNNLVKFRDNYMINDIIAVAPTDNTIVSRIIFNWSGMFDTANSSVKLRPLNFDIYVLKSQQYNVGANALLRRQDYIVQELKQILNNQRVEGFLFNFYDAGDLQSSSPDYSRGYVIFRTKYIV